VSELFEAPFDPTKAFDVAPGTNAYSHTSAHTSGLVDDAILDPWIDALIHFGSRPRSMVRGFAPVLRRHCSSDARRKFSLLTGEIAG